MEKIKIIYYSGTDGSKRVAECFERKLGETGMQTSIHRLSAGAQDQDSQYDLLIVIFAVHACNAPEPVYKWIEKTGHAGGKPAVVLSVSGGGEVSPNTACRLHCIKRLEKKGFVVVYEDMIIMPSNWIFATKEPLALLLLQTLPQKVAQITNDILSGFSRRIRPRIIDRFFSLIGEAEKFGAKYFGRKIRISAQCTGCGWCVDNCPAGNITMEYGKPVFGHGCQLCLCCIYGCPNGALSPGMGKFIAIKEGYDLGKLEKKLPFTDDVDIDALAKGYLWSGVRKYLTNIKAGNYE